VPKFRILTSILRISLCFYELKTWLAIRSVRKKLELAGGKLYKSCLRASELLDVNGRRLGRHLGFTFLNRPSD
jgi:hypothetical protein